MGRKSVSQEVKWQIIALFKDNTKSQQEIARLCGFSLCCVQTMLKNYKLSNYVKDSPRVDRPSKLKSRDQRLLYRRVTEDPKISYQELSAEFSNKAGYVSVSHSTVRKCLNKKGIDCYVAARKPLLRVTNRIKR